MARDYRLWKQSEIKVLKAGLLPEGRSYHACVLFCKRNGIPFPGICTVRANEELLQKFSKGGKK